MTGEELHKIGTALQPFLQFLRDTEKGESWHHIRQQLWGQADRQIAALVDKSPDKKKDKKKPLEEPKPPGKAKPANNRSSQGKH